MKNAILLVVITFCFLQSGTGSNIRLDANGPIVMRGGLDAELLANSQKVEKDSIMIVEQLPQSDKNSQKVKKDTIVQRKIIIKKGKPGNEEMSEFNMLYKVDTAQYNAFKKKMELLHKSLSEANKGIQDSLKKATAKLYGKSFVFSGSGDDGTVFNFNGVPGMPGMPGIPDPPSNRNMESSTLNLSKTFEKGESMESTKKFPVSSTFDILEIYLRGKVKSGTITVTLTKPDGAKYKSIVIDPISDVSFSTRKFYSDKDSKEWIGDWQINIKADKADGNYSLRVETR